MRNRAGLLVALGADNFGSGLFLPVVLLYVTRVVGVPLAVAGTAVTAGTVAGLRVLRPGRGGGGLLSVAGTGERGYRVAVIADTASFVVCALVLALAVRIPRAAAYPYPGGRSCPL
jgi:hypothetical protein